jgi:hypothetical protein
MDGHDPDAGTSSASESSVEAPRLSKRKAHGDTSVPLPSKRKTTYYLRKDEIESLQDQIKSLQEKLQKCEREARLGKLTLPNVEATNEFLANCVEQNSLSVAGTQSMMTAYNLAMVQSDGVVPLQSYVHLPADADQRTEVLSGLFQSKLRSAVRFMGERTRFLDLRVRHHQTEQFELPTGEVAVVALDVAQFEGGHSLRQVYDAFMYFLVNQEISVSEKLGVLTIRESDELDEIKYCQTRFLSSVRGGLEVESNAVVFAACVDATAESPGYAVGMLDFVDHDDLYPYRPDLCVRKDVTGAVTFNEIPSLTGGKPMIAMARWSHVRMPPPTFPLSTEAVTEVRTGMLQWCNIVSDIMKERLATIPPAP